MTSIAPTRTLIVGSGGREHALAWKLASEPGGNEIVVAPGNDAIAREPRVRLVAGVDPLDPAAVVAVARREAVELVVIGPEASLAAGVTDALQDAGIAVFGPTQAAARIESSKAFCHEIADAAGVPMARAGTFGEPDGARRFAAELAADGRGVVVKADGLAAGKGVTVCDSLAEAERAIDGVLGAGASATVVIEERLVGREASLIALCDGREAVALPPARDYKRLLDGDAGPNTGGMGAYSPLPDLTDDAAYGLLDAFHRPILAELARRSTPFRGALYAGLMLTPGGPVLLECNARFGDPETQAILPRLAVALGPLLLAAARRDLRSALTGWPIARSGLPTLPGAAVAIVVAAAGYPGQPRAGDRIEGLDDAARTGALIFHAGTARAEDGTFRTAGGRVLSVVGRGPDLATAHAAATLAAERIHGSGLQRRHDIGLEAVAAGAGR
jgi:phosphoribosylamine--glycine ligase